MSSNEEIQVVDKQKKYFTQIPNIVFKIEMPHAAFRLYCNLQRICRDTRGSCWMSLDSLTKECQMDRRTVISSRTKLKELGLIEIENSRRKDGSERITISMVDLWHENFQYFEDDKTTTRSESDDTKLQLGPYKTTTRSIQNYNSNKKSIKNKDKEEEKRVPPASRDGNNHRANGKSSPTKETKSKSKSKNGHFINPSRKTKFHRLAEKLFGAVQNKSKFLPKDKKKVEDTTNKWANTFQEFLGESDCTVSEFEDLLDWYIKNRDRKYMPQCIAATTFCDSILRIEAARSRIEQDTSSYNKREETEEEKEEKRRQRQEERERMERWEEQQRQNIIDSVTDRTF